MADQLKKNIQTHASHQAFVRKTLADLEKSSKNINKEEWFMIVNLKSTLEEQYEAIVVLDRDIFDLLSDKEAVEEEEITVEIEDAGKLRAEIKITTTILGDINTQRKSAKRD